MPLKWTKRQISSETFEAAGVFDVDGDGVPDIVAGGFWYRGPDFRQRFLIDDRHFRHIGWHGHRKCEPDD